MGVGSGGTLVAVAVEVLVGVSVAATVGGGATTSGMCRLNAWPGAKKAAVNRAATRRIENRVMVNFLVGVVLEH